MNNNYLVPFFLGTFSGFLATLPLGPAKILAVRKFLIVTKGTDQQIFNIKSSNVILIASIGGLIFGQLLLFLGLYFPSLYSLWVKPHFFSLIILPIVFFYLNKIKTLNFDVYNNQSLSESESNYSRIITAFLETLFLQLLNPIAFPNPIFSRLNSIFLFRYSTFCSFLVGNVLGFLSGYATFFLLTLVLLKKLELDAPTIYRLVKIIIHRSFFLVFFIVSLICLSRTPMPSMKKIFPQSTTKLYFGESWFDKMWPDSFFSYDVWKRPLRLLEYDKNNFNPEGLRPFNKMVFSQYFFEVSNKNGKYELFHNFPQNLSIVSREIGLILKRTSVPKKEEKNIFQEWITEKENRENEINKNIINRFKSLEKGISFPEIVQTKVSSLNIDGTKISKEFDPRLSSDTRGIKNFLNKKSYLFFTEEYLFKKDSLAALEQNKLKSVYTKNKLKYFLAENIDLLQKLPILPWKSIEKYFTDPNENATGGIKNKALIKDSYSREYLDISQQKTLFSGNELSIKISNFVQKLFNLQNETKNKLQRDNIEFDENENFPGLINIYKPMPLWSSEIDRKKLERPDAKNVRSAIANFVRHSLPGTIRARRRKALSWNIFQNKPHDPIFLYANQSINVKKYFSKRKLENFSIKNKKIQDNQDVTILKRRWSTQRFQFIRGSLLSIQAYVRKYLKLPLLIIVKNLSRQLLFQPTEWEKDWTALSQEIYIDCDYDGNELYVGVNFPNFFLEEGAKQIKIVQPFQLRFWPRSIPQNSVVPLSDNYSYLNIWGQETITPFGKVKKVPSFWQILIERVKLLFRYKILKKFSFFDKRLHLIDQNQQKIDKTQNQLTNELLKESSLSSLPKINQDSKDLLKKSKEKKLLVGKKQINVNNDLNIQINRSLNDTKTDQSQNIITNLKQSNFSNKSTFNNLTVREKKIETKSSPKKYTIQGLFISSQKNWFHFYRGIVKIERQFVFTTRKKALQVKRSLTKIIAKIFKNFHEFQLLLYRLLTKIYYQLFELSNLFLFKLKTFTKEDQTKEFQNKALYKSTIFDLDHNKKLSQAYIIHSIWEDRMMSRPHISSLMKIWNSKNPLKKNLEMYLREQGVLGNYQPENIAHQHWKEWLKDFRGYTPSFKIWNKISPKNWTQTVERYWKQMPSDILEKKLEKNSIKFEKNVNRNYLNYHGILFNQAQKLAKLWKFNILFHNYTGLYNDSDIDQFFLWKTKESETKANLFFNELSLKTPTITKSAKKEQSGKKNILGSPATFSWISQAEEKNTTNIIAKQNILHEIPVIQRDKIRKTSDVKLDTLPHRVNFLPVWENRWKSYELKEKFRNLVKFAMQKQILRESTPNHKQLSKLPSEMRKELILFSQDSTPENIFFTRMLEDWRTKLLDDELFMYNIISSILRFNIKTKKRSLTNFYNSFSSFPLSKSDSIEGYLVVPEEILLPNDLRELRILEALTLAEEGENNKPNLSILDHKKKNGKENEMNKIVNFFDEKFHFFNNRQTIVRFLWPAHRIEDLACMNRFWIATANQSRFSLLRIHSYPPFF